MKSTFDNDPVLKSESQTINEKLNDADGSEKEKVVIPDECGDTMWDEVLDQDKKNLPAKESKENGHIPDNINDAKKKENIISVKFSNYIFTLALRYKSNIFN